MSIPRLTHSLIHTPTPTHSLTLAQARDFEQIADIVHQGVQIASKVQAAAGSTKMVDFRAKLAGQARGGWVVVVVVIGPGRVGSGRVGSERWQSTSVKVPNIFSKITTSCSATARESCENFVSILF
jgi:hypothetical protein